MKLLVPIRLLPSIVLLSLSISFQLYGQSKSGLKALSERDFTAAKGFFEKGLDDPLDKPICHYGLALLYLDSFNQVQLDQAYIEILEAQKSLRKVPSKKRGKVEKVITSKRLREIQGDIEENAYQVALEGENLVAYEHFLETYTRPKPAFKRKITESRNQLVFDQVMQKGNLSAIQEALQKYGRSFSTYNGRLYKILEEELWDKYFAEHGLDGYDQFASLYPKHPVVVEGAKAPFDRAVKVGTYQAYERFAKDYSESFFKGLALDSIELLLLEVNKLALYKHFFDDFKSEPDLSNTLWNAFYQSFKGDELLPGKLQYFQKTYPEFPDEELIEEDLNRSIDVLAERVTTKGSLPAYVSFLENYPDYHRIDSVWLAYYEAYKEDHHEIKDLNRFQMMHEEFPFPEMIKVDRTAFREKELTYRVDRLERQGDFAQMSKFLKDNPLPAFYDRLKDRMFQYVSSSSSAAQYRFFIENFPNDPRRDHVFLKLYYEETESLDTVQYERFRKKYPDFPFQEKISEDLDILTQYADVDFYAFEQSKRNAFSNVIKQLAPRDVAYDLLRKMTKSDFEDKNWEKVRTTTDQFESDFGELNAKYTQFRDMTTEQGLVLNVRSFGDSINTVKGNEYKPVITADGQVIYFCGRYRSDNLDASREDIYYARLINGSWSGAKLVPDVNEPSKHEAPEAISADGSSFIIFKNGNLMQTEKTIGGWTEPVPLPESINRSSWQADAVYSADGNAILFASEGTGYGQKDIFVSVKDKEGHWQEAINLGRTINTSSNDRSPFLHPDMKTLYFSSEGHEGFGNLDVYVTRRLDESWTNWSTPVNLGYVINNEKHNWGYKITTDGKQAVYAERKSAYGQSDILICELPEEFRPDPVSTISGRIVNQDGEPISTNIIWKNLETQNTVTITKNNPVDGTFFITMPEKGAYSYTISKEGYFPISGNVQIEFAGQHITVERSLEMTTIDEMETGDLTLPLNNVFFETDEATIKPASFAELNNLAEWIRENKLNIELLGHTDNVGNDEYNLELSDRRVKAVREYLIDRGCSGENIQANGYGEQIPVASNDSESGRALNRRVEIKLIKQE